MTVRVLALGSPPDFRRHVASALDAPAESIAWFASANEAEMALDLSTQPPDVVAVSAFAPLEDVIALADHIRAQAPATAIVVVRNAADAPEVTALVRAGVRDVIDIQHGPQELRDALQRAMSWSASLKATRQSGDVIHEGDDGQLITVFSSKGGTGKTFLSTSLAVAIAQMSIDTALIDSDVAMGDVFSYFGAEPRRSFYDVLSLNGNVDRRTLTTFGSPLTDNLWAFGSPADVAAQSVTQDAMTRTLRAFKKAFPYTIVDVAAGYGDEVLAALDQSDVVLLISQLDVVGIKHLSKAMETLSYIGVSKERMMFVLNRADSKVGLEPSDVERVMGFKADVMIPSSRSVPAALNSGRPVLLDDPKSPVSVAIRALAAKLGARLSVNASGDVSPQKKKRFAFGKVMGE